MLKKAFAAVLVAIPMGMAAPKPASAQSNAPPHPQAVESALLAYNLFHYKVEYGLDGVNGSLIVTLFGPPAPQMPDQIFAVAWAVEPLRFSDIVVAWNGGDVRRSYDELAVTLGPRPVGLDQKTVYQALLKSAFGDWKGFGDAFEALSRLFAALVLAVCIAVTMLVVVFTAAVGVALRARRERSRAL